MLIAATLAGVLVFARTPEAVAKVYYARQEALALAFPGADRVEARDFVLTQAQHDQVESLARAPLESDLVTVYVGWKEGAAFAYALFDTHEVRSFHETLLVILNSDGVITGTHVLAFHEPEEYLPPKRWMDQFSGKQLDDKLYVGKGLAAITGSTLSTRAVATGTRRSLAIWTATIGGQ